MKVEKESVSNVEENKEKLAIQSLTGASRDLIESVANNVFKKYIDKYNKFMNTEEAKAALKVADDEFLQARTEYLSVKPKKENIDQDDKNRKEMKERNEVVPEFSEVEKAQRSEIINQFEQASGNYQRTRLRREEFLPASIKDVLGLIAVECKGLPQDTGQSNALMKEVKTRLQVKSEYSQGIANNEIDKTLVGYKVDAAQEVMINLSKSLLLTLGKKRVQSWTEARKSVSDARASVAAASKLPDEQIFSNLQDKCSNMRVFDKDNVKGREDLVSHFKDRVADLKEYINGIYKFSLAGGDNIVIEKTEAVLDQVRMQIAAFEGMPEIYKKRLGESIGQYIALEKELSEAINNIKNVRSSNHQEGNSEKVSPRNTQKAAADNSNNGQRTPENERKGPNVNWVQGRLQEKKEAQQQLKQPEQSGFVMGKK